MIKVMPETNEKKATYTAREDAARYLKALNILNDLRQAYRWNDISMKDFKRLRKVALDGNVEQANMELAQMLGRRM